jgi:hypothetical protein
VESSRLGGLELLVIAGGDFGRDDSVDGGVAWSMLHLSPTESRNQGRGKGNINREGISNNWLILSMEESECERRLMHF